MFYDKLSKLPLVGGSEMRKNVKKLMKINQKTKVLGELFRHFTTNGWIFESIKLL
jgi:hypothetical protein